MSEKEYTNVSLGGKSPKGVKGIDRNYENKEEKKKVNKTPKVDL
ncbi:hypothetical protein [Bacillus sp. M6-12]|nr:hypothetical protein [Bacillus sp. M6-12]